MATGLSLRASRPFEIVDPTTETPFATVAMGGAEDVDRAVVAARRGLPAFSGTAPAERIALVRPDHCCL